MHAIHTLLLRALASRSSIVDGDSGGAPAPSVVDDNAGNAPADKPSTATSTDVHPAHQWLDAIETEVGAWFIHSTTAQRIRAHVAKRDRICLLAMPRKAPTPCRHFGCRMVVTEPGFCAEHAREQSGWASDRRRGSRHARGYGSAWTKLRELVLKRDGGLCQPAFAPVASHAPRRSITSCQRAKAARMSNRIFSRSAIRATRRRRLARAHAAACVPNSAARTASQVTLRPPHADRTAARWWPLPKAAVPPRSRRCALRARLAGVAKSVAGRRMGPRV